MFCHENELYATVRVNLINIILHGRNKTKEHILFYKLKNTQANLDVWMWLLLGRREWVTQKGPGGRCLDADNALLLDLWGSLCRNVSSCMVMIYVVLANIKYFEHMCLNASVAQLDEHCPRHQKAAGSILIRVHAPGRRFNPR